MSAAAESSTVVTNYFTCTLGEAVRLSQDLGDLQTINNFIDHQAKTYPRENAVAFPVPRGEHYDWSFELFTFEDLRNGSIAIALEVAHINPQSANTLGPECVALLCPSSIDFLFAWLGLMRAGLSVLLVAPQCQPAAIAHLCKLCDVSILFHDESYTDLAFAAASEAESSLISIELPWQVQKRSITSLVRNSNVPSNFKPQANINAHDVAFIFHTSGTSTGLPKPIFQSHRAAVGVLPVLDGRQSASFTTTPLYHGGIADCLRAWPSRALIWLFPAADVPITIQNISSCLSVITKATSESSAAHLKYFSCVPYVLQMCAEDSSGLDILLSLEIVGVGGAALIPKVGDSLVERGVNLVSRFGSAECGFLLSSHRDYSTDKDWQFLRLSSESDCLCFEEQDDGSGLFELIVEKGWPHMAKTNRKGGDFATHDLFEPHQTIEGAWRYHSRSDSQITMTTGKKFDPAPLEDLISSSSLLIREVMVFGSNRPNPGVLVFPSKESLNIRDSVLEDEIWTVLQNINSKGQAHTRIYRDMLIIMSVDLPMLERSAKGTLSRKIIEEKFAKDINWAYSRDDVPKTEHIERTIEDSDIERLVREAVTDALEMDHSLSDDADFYAHGIDSATCARIRSLLQKLVKSQDRLPWNVVYDCGNINRLSDFIIRFRNGNVGARSQMNEETEMLELVKRFSKFDTTGQVITKERKADNAPYVVILTGATGALGAHILDILRKSPFTSKIFCLVRAVDHYTARSRVSASLVKRKKSSLDISDPKVWCAPYKLSDANLGISEMELSHIRKSATHIIHAAWAVNFSLPLQSFVAEHIAGIHNLLTIAHSCSNAIQFSFCSSTASVLGENRGSVIEEKTSTSTSDAGVTGYSRSKWVAEAICAAAAKSLPGTVNVLRIGQLTGDTTNGIWNISEAWPLMLMTVDALDCLPKLTEPLSWLPLDIAASAVVEIALQLHENDKQSRVYHLVNNSSETTWSDLLSWCGETRSKPFDIVSPRTWLERLDSYPNRHPAKNLLGLWTNAYGDDDGEMTQNAPSTKTVFSIVEAQKNSSAMRNVLPVDQALVNKIWAWLEGEIKAAKELVYVSRNRFDSV